VFDLDQQGINPMLGALRTSSKVETGTPTRYASSPIEFQLIDNPLFFSPMSGLEKSLWQLWVGR